MKPETINSKFVATFEDVLCFVSDRIDDPGWLSAVANAIQTDPKAKAWYALLAGESSDEDEEEVDEKNQDIVDDKVLVSIFEALEKKQPVGFYTSHALDTLKNWSLADCEVPMGAAARSGEEQFSRDIDEDLTIQVVNDQAVLRCAEHQLPFGLVRLVAQVAGKIVGTCVRAAEFYNTPPQWRLRVPVADLVSDPRPQGVLKIQAVPAQANNGALFSAIVVRDLQDRLPAGALHERQLLQDFLRILSPMDE